ncbi:MAG: hypothetical protein K0S74_1738 [Chlamydiales bacterium]|jgi:hypothetical protein|nr:hypothetical protein [Chlamydiales bacterium]
MFIGSGACAQQLYQDLPEHKIIYLMKAASLWRLERKNLYLTSWCTDSLHALPTGIALALGYKKNGESFLNLYFWLKLQDIKGKTFEYLFSLALGVCGFFEKHFHDKWGDSDYYRTLLSAWKLLEKGVTYREHLMLNQIRPMNHPVRRIAALIHLILDPNATNFMDQIDRAWQSQALGLNCLKSVRKFLKLLFELLPSYQDAYWNHHYTFELNPKGEFLTLLGDDLKQEIIINAVLPLLLERIKFRENPDEWKAFQCFYEKLTASNSSKAKYLSHRFFGNSPKKAIMKSAQIEQGAYQIHKDFCIHYEASCQGCPFVKNYQHNTNFS